MTCHTMDVYNLHVYLGCILPGVSFCLWTCHGLVMPAEKKIIYVYMFFLLLKPWLAVIMEKMACGDNVQCSLSVK